MNAPRALPIWSGPVGLADTNSTLTDRGRVGATRPQAGGSARIAATVASSASSRRRRLRNPGGATSALAIGVEVGSAAASLVTSAANACAMASGAMRYGRASFIARLLAKSPCAEPAGRSISTGGRVASAGKSGSAPEATARSQARATAARAWVRMGGEATDSGTSDIGIRPMVAARYGTGVARTDRAIADRRPADGD